MKWQSNIKTHSEDSFLTSNMAWIADSLQFTLMHFQLPLVLSCYRKIPWENLEILINILFLKNKHGLGCFQVGSVNSKFWFSLEKHFIQGGIIRYPNIRASGGWPTEGANTPLSTIKSFLVFLKNYFKIILNVL